GLSEADRARMRRQGVLPLETQDALHLLDTALATTEPNLVAIRLDAAALRTEAANDSLAPLMRELVPARARTELPGSRPDSGYRQRLAGLPEAERAAALLSLVRTEIAGVLGHGTTGGIPAGRAFTELGFDSLTAVDLRNRLNKATGLSLPTTLIFDYPNPAELAGFLLPQLVEVRPDADQRRAALDSTSSPVNPAADEPIAIVGMACRYPGGISSPEDLWRMVMAGDEGISLFPENRDWDLDALYSPDADQLGTFYTKEGGFLHDAGDFDAEFFGISPREALAMDPQQRLLLETSWEVFERAGIDPATVRGTDTGVFAGVMYHDYASRLSTVPDELEGYLGNGSAGSIASGRLSYTFGLEGPAVTVDTACSSSLVALHLAVQSLRQGECSLALAGGVTVMSTPGAFVEFSRQRGLALDGRCKSYAQAADGTGWSEGVGVLLVERLSDAVRNGHRVLAVVRGSAVNQDGASNGLTAPNGPSQQRVIRQALASARLSAAEVDAVEGHGTGTTLGDPIEAQALLATYGQERQKPLWLGSVKSNLGHTQAAAGVAGVIKMVMAMRHGVLPATLHVDEPSSHVDWSAGGVRLLTEQTAWPEVDRPRRAGVSSFGISGTNAHVILEQGPAELPVEVPVQAGPVPVVLSAAGEVALRAQAARLAPLVEDSPVAVLGQALATTRAVLDHRAVVVAGDAAELRQGLLALAAGEPGAGVVTGSATNGGWAFLFAGQGAQRGGMGSELYERFPVFARALDEALELLDIRGEFFGADAEVLEGTGIAQPALFAFEVALFRLWESWGVRPDAVAGHSVGEVVAAHVAGVLSLADACTLVAARGRLMQALPAGGVMVAVEVTEEEVLPLLGDDVSLAAVNGPTSVVVSGAGPAVERVVAALSGRRSRRLRVSHAFHSPLMEPMLDEFRQVLAGLSFESPTLRFVSTVTGAPVSEEIATPEYWVEHARKAVRFADAVSALHADGVETFVELGPDGVLSAMGSAVAPAGVFVPSVRRDRDEPASVLTALAHAHVRGASVAWDAVFGRSRGPAVDLPTYAFQRRHYWLKEGTQSAGQVAAGFGAAGHPLLGAVVELPDSGGCLLTGTLALEAQEWLADHVVAGTALVPGTAFLECALRAGREVGCDRVAELALEVPLVLPERGGVAVQVAVAAQDEHGARPFSVYARRGEDAWVRHATGVLTGTVPGEPVSGLPGAEAGGWPPAHAVPVDLADFYPRLAEAGFGYGPAFQGLRSVWRHEDEFWAEVSLPEDVAAQAGLFSVHPALLDAVLHATALIRPEAGLPFTWSGVRVARAGAAELRVRLVPAADGALSLTAHDASGDFVLSVDSLTFRQVSERQLRAARGGQQALFRVDWQPVAPAGGSAPGYAVLGRDTLGILLRGTDRLVADLGSLIGELPSETASGMSPGTPSGASGEVPELVVLPCFGAPGLARSTEGADLRPTLERVLTILQDWVADPRLEHARLAVVTRGAVAPHDGDDVPDLTGAAVWGLVRAAQAEYPGRFVLVDVDEPDALAPALAAALAAREPQLAVRSGALRVPRLVPTAGRAEPVDWDREGTVLITGGTGALGTEIARHLVTARGVRHLLLVSRGGGGAGTEALAAELAEHGAEVRAVACDVSDEDDLARVLAAVPVDHPLRAVIHAAGVVDDAVLPSQSAGRLAAVLAPKADAALHLHRLTRHLSLDAFVLFSSTTSLFGGPGQANYAAANALLNGLARHRRAAGLPASALVWGRWESDGGIVGGLAEADVRRMARAGIGALSSAEALALFDAAVGAGEAELAAVLLDRAALRAQARSGTLLPLLHGLVPASQRPGGAAADPDGGAELRTRLAGAAEPDRADLVRRVVVRELAGVLGHHDAGTVDADRGFFELGLDSLTAIDLRTRLDAATGLRLPTAVLFDHPNATALARHLTAALAPADAVADGDAELRRIIAAIPVDRLRDAGVLDLLLRLGGSEDEQKSMDHHMADSGGIDEMALDELIQMAQDDQRDRD
ncbi:SDR family NAD(P)-dependent oxidoreductase, partial [Kitasatospora sp. NPDC058218]|uniref:type I polyketide synthase n=1 Tax=Kitasatospora sp. NPDC058218 TaxID=3346385 RepID=UPI0036DC9DE7